jgi:hypothetical protein
MIELLFVIVIMGIIGGIALEAIRQYYEGIYRSQTYAKRVNEADHILEQLSKYFENAIDMSIVNMDKDAGDGALVGTCAGDPGEEAENVAHDYTVAMVGVDTDSLRVVGTPGWSEAPSTFTGTSLIANDANFTAANGVITSLYPASDLNHSAIYNYQSIATALGSCTYFNWDGTGTNEAYYTITNVVNSHTLTLADNYIAHGHTYDGVVPDKIKKYLVHTGYAFRVLDTGEFIMFSNFRPWRGEIYSSGARNTLGTNVASFYADFNNTNSHNIRGSVWRLKVCMRGLDSDLNTSNVASQAICRERNVHVRY